MLSKDYKKSLRINYKCSKYFIDYVTVHQLKSTMYRTFFKKFIKSRSQRSTLYNFLHKQKGATYVEAALILPLLGFIFLGTWEMYRIHKTYMNLSHSAREAAVLAITAPNLSQTSLSINPIEESEYTNCLTLPNTSGSYCGHTIVQWAARNVFFSQPYYIENNSLNVTTSFDKTSRIATVTMEVRYKALTPLRNNLVLRVSEKVKHLGA
jgi:Flp pilus assembly protein TadG